jgi:ABC-type uncharacterized transport system substrate-binding protein
MRKSGALLISVLCLFISCQKSERETARLQEKKPYTIGIFQFTDSITLNEVRKGLLQALEDGGLRDGVDTSLRIRNAMGDMSEVQRIAQEFALKKMDIVVPLSTQCLQAALREIRRTPIVFSSVANPYILGAGKSAKDHLAHVTGVASTGPVKKTIAFIKVLLPNARRIGILWTPSELNSQYYLELAREEAGQVGLEVVAVPVTNPNEVLLSAQALVNKKVDVLFPISDNTINASFEALGKVAEENSLPLFGGFLLSTEQGACAAMGYSFFEMGYKTGQIVLRVRGGESPAQIPFQYMDKVNLYLNLEAAAKQGVKFSESVLKRADKIVH